MKKLLLIAGILVAFNANADLVTSGGCSYENAPISAVYQQADSTWVIQLYGGVNAIGGFDVRVNHSQVAFKGIKGTKSLNDFKLGWVFEDRYNAGIGNDLGQCDYTLTGVPVYVIKR